MFESLSEKVQLAIRRLTGKGRLGEADVSEALREIRVALLEADVNYKVVKEFAARVRDRAVGREVMGSLSPARQVARIVHEEMSAIMGGADQRLVLSPRPPSVIMLVGLEGSGKTTTAGKLGIYLKKQGRRVILVAADVYRPAAGEQLKVVGGQAGLPVYAGAAGEDPVTTVRNAVLRAAREMGEVLIVDTAGRLHVDEPMMVELEEIKKVANPCEILLVADAMTGQEAVNVASAFNARLGLTGVVLTKLDGDARGGAALSIRAATGVPVKFVGTGERLDGLEAFHPERMASRILGMGDVLTLVERAEEAFDAEKSKEIERKVRKAEFGLDDFLEQLRGVRKMGPLDQVLAMIPGLARQAKKVQDAGCDERELARIEAIINSMTKAERASPSLIDASRKRRIAAGSGTTVQDVNRLLKQFEQVKLMVRQIQAFEKGRGGAKQFRGPLGPLGRM
ncbi:MAG: signal recognition particle protein [Firmicutes bacterium]|jgi:signal recognition particle subunit SRP54|nr:signal recognition particle protein [Bacillota bacterium]